MSRLELARFMTIPDLAEELNTSASQIRALIKSGDLPAIQIGGRSQWRIERTKLEGYIADAYQRTAEAIRRGDLPAGTAG
ncbi:helix-turn-helix domain-containing protein [Arthrobacter sp. Bz4]|uniref:helix-turn-helix domain-containing protein n=1 Tax=Arthrobacter sp. Bz4 TaxID=2171979 RepID=UPI000D51F9CF|nr:helix-turn-helix domain-containing protein [Arthrobacter sp. Bz4]PVE14903.1 DNA-binding protein [Arthrobacter sp. Bz4]